MTDQTETLDLLAERYPAVKELRKRLELLEYACQGWDDLFLESLRITGKTFRSINDENVLARHETFKQLTAANKKLAQGVSPAIETGQDGLTEAQALLRIWQTWLGPRRASCDAEGMKLWDRIDAVLANLRHQAPVIIKPEPAPFDCCAVCFGSGGEVDCPCNTCGGTGKAPAIETGQDGLTDEVVRKSALEYSNIAREGQHYFFYDAGLMEFARHLSTKQAASVPPAHDVWYWLNKMSDEDIGQEAKQYPGAAERVRQLLNADAVVSGGVPSVGVAEGLAVTQVLPSFENAEYAMLPIYPTDYAVTLGGRAIESSLATDRGDFRKAAYKAHRAMVYEMFESVPFKTNTTHAEPLPAAPVSQEVVK